MGQDQTLRLTAAVIRGACRQLQTMAHTSTASSVPDAVPRGPGWGPGECGLVRDRFSLCTQQLNWCAVDELSFLCLLSWAVLWDVSLDYCIIVLHVNRNPTRYRVITYNRSYLNLFATSSLDHSEALNDQGRRVKLEFKKICDETAPFWVAEDNVFFCLCEKGPFLNLKISCIINGLREEK